MGNKTVEIIKELSMSILIVICIALVLAVIFYDKISLSKVIPQPEEYKLSTEMTQYLEESKLDNIEEVIVNYYIDATDLNKYEKNNEYVKGNSNPFDNLVVMQNKDSNQIEQNTSYGDNSTGFYEDDGTK